MVDIFSTLVALMLFLGALIFTLLDWGVSAYNDYSFQKRHFEWQIQFAQTHGNEMERIKNEYLRNQLIVEYRPETKKYILIIAGLIVVLFGVIALMGNSLPYFTQMPLTNENSSGTCQNITYVVNNYYNNYTIDQITVENENRAFSIEELKYLIQTGKGH